MKTIIKSDKQTILFTHQKCHGRAPRCVSKPFLDQQSGERLLFLLSSRRAYLYVRTLTAKVGLRVHVTSEFVERVGWNLLHFLRRVYAYHYNIRASCIYILCVHSLKYTHTRCTAEFIAQVGNPHENRWVLCNDTVLTRCLDPPRG